MGSLAKRPVAIRREFTGKWSTQGAHAVKSPIGHFIRMSLFDSKIFKSCPLRPAAAPTEERLEGPICSARNFINSKIALNLRLSEVLNFSHTRKPIVQSP